MPVDWIHMKVRVPLACLRAGGGYNAGHLQGTLKQVTVENMDKYVVRDPLIGEMLKRLAVNAKLFLLTNSDWCYSNVRF